MIKFVHCDDGSFLYIPNITRLFLAEDTITKGCSIKASVIGPAMPFLLHDYGSRAEAEHSLENLITQIEGEN